MTTDHSGKIKWMKIEWINIKYKWIYFHSFTFNLSWTSMHLFDHKISNGLYIKEKKPKPFQLKFNNRIKQFPSCRNYPKLLFEWEHGARKARWCEREKPRGLNSAEVISRQITGPTNSIRGCLLFYRYCQKWYFS